MPRHRQLFTADLSSGRGSQAWIDRSGYGDSSIRDLIGRPHIMDHPRLSGWAALRNLAVPALALAVVATLPAAATKAEAAPEFAAASVDNHLPATVKGQFLSYNDFHGAIDPPAGSGAVVNAGGTSTPAGGVEYLATWLKK